MKSIITLFTNIVHVLLIIPFMILIFFTGLIKKVLLKKNQSPKLMWGPDPLISNKHWSRALERKGYHSRTVMYEHYYINEKSDFDIYVNELIFKSSNKILKNIIYAIRPFYATLYMVWNYDIIHHCYLGLFLRDTPIWFLEAQILHWAGCKSVVLPFGGDFYKYSKILDPSLRHASLLSYYNQSKIEDYLQQRNSYWTKHTDAMACWVQLDGNGRWDLLPTCGFVIDTEVWIAKKDYNQNDGFNGAVTIAHTPNHRGFKGTEFIVKAVEDLQQEGLKINLNLIEKKPNKEVQRVLQEEADILVEQIIGTGYAFNGIEGMSSGLAVIAGLEQEIYTQVFRRYSYLNECPILSAGPETIKEQIRLLVTNPELRETLGKANRQYAEKYHSYETAGYMFDKLYQKIWLGKDEDTLNLFHPILTTSYNNSKPLIQHPLVNNKYPQN